MNAEIEDPGAATIEAIVGEAPLALPESIDALEGAVGLLEEEIEQSGLKAARAAEKAITSGKRGGKV